MTKRVLFVAVLLVTLAACGRVPDECISLCQQIEKWTIQCKAPLLSVDTCKRAYCRTDGFNTTAVNCWNTLMEWTPNLAAELDCSKPPPKL